MAIQDDFTVDFVDRKITYTTAFVDDRPPTIYTVNELYSFLQDLFDEPAQMDDPIPMSAQTPTQYTILYPWFIDNESMKALYGGSIQTSGWTKSGSDGITALRWASATSAPESGDIGKEVGNVGDAATGIILAIDTVRQVVWVRNNNSGQFANSDVVDDTATGLDPDFTLEAEAGFQTGESEWSNLFSVGSLQTETEIYVGQEPDQLGGTAYHDADADSKFERRIEKIDEWWDSDVDFFTGSPNLLGGAGHFDVLVLTRELGVLIDAARLAVFARQHGTIFSSFELIGGVGNFVVPFASTGADLNAADGPYNVGFDAGAGGKGQLDVGDVLENDTGTTPVGRLRAVVTAVVGTTSGDFDYYLIGENEPLTTTDRTLRQFLDNENMAVRTDAFTFDIDAAGSPVTEIGPGTAQGITITFDDFQVDVDEVGGDEEYAAQIDCNNVALAAVYKRMQFLASRGNQDGTTPDTQDLLLPSGNVAAPTNEAGEFYRAVGDIIITWDARAAAGISEGELVVGSISGAYGVVVSATENATGIGVLTQVKGTFVENDVVSDIDDGSTNTVTLDVNIFTAIVDNTGAPFGTFAGGRWFVAQGVVLLNVPAADANNWETVSLDGVRRVPPAVRTITFDGLVANDRATIFEVLTAGGIDVSKAQNGVGGAGAAVSDVAIPLDASIALDVPPTGWIRVVDLSLAATGVEYRFEYSSIVTTTVNLRAVAPDPGTVTTTNSGTVLEDTGQFTTFGTDGEVKVGHEIRNITDGSIATVLRKIDNNQIETTPLSGGGDDTWQSGDTYEVNQVVIALVDADTVYFPFIDDVASGASIAKTVKFVSITELIARMRFSDPDIGGQRQLPFERVNFQLTDADLTVTAIRNPDTIAS